MNNAVKDKILGKTMALLVGHVIVGGIVIYWFLLQSALLPKPWGSVEINTTRFLAAICVFLFSFLIYERSKLKGSFQFFIIALFMSMVALLLLHGYYPEYAGVFMNLN